MQGYDVKRTASLYLSRRDGVEIGLLPRVYARLRTSLGTARPLGLAVCFQRVEDRREVGRQGFDDVDGGPRHGVHELQAVRVQEGPREAELAGQGVGGLAVDRITDDRVA